MEHTRVQHPPFASSNGSGFNNVRPRLQPAVCTEGSFLLTFIYIKEVPPRCSWCRCTFRPYVKRRRRKVLWRPGAPEMIEFFYVNNHLDFVRSLFVFPFRVTKNKKYNQQDYVGPFKFFEKHFTGERHFFLFGFLKTKSFCSLFAVSKGALNSLQEEGRKKTQKTLRDLMNCVI